MNVTYQQIAENDTRQLEALRKVYVDVFEMNNDAAPDKLHLQDLLFNKQVIFQVALADDVVVAGLTAYILPSIYSATCEVYIYDLAVLPAFQRKGIGSHLINSLKETCKEKGYKEMFVQAVVEDTYAIDFYRTTGGREEAVVSFSYQL